MDATSAYCPICGKPNQCALIANSSANQTSDCWCKTEKFPQDLLAKLSQEGKHNTCICQACVKAYNRTHDK